MTHKTWNLKLAAIGLFCTLSTHALAMDTEQGDNSAESIEITRRIQAATNQDYARSLFTDMVVKENKSYAQYAQACKAEGVEPFLPQGLYNTPTKVITNNDIERGLKDAFLKVTIDKSWQISVSSSGVEIFNVLSGHLLPKYMDFFKKDFGKKRSFKGSSALKKEILKTLTPLEQDIERIGDPLLMRVVLNTMNSQLDAAAFNVFPQPAAGGWGMDYLWQAQQLHSQFGGEPLLFLFAGARNNKCVFGVEKFVEALEQNMPYNTIPEVKKQNLQDILKGINSVFNVDGKQVYDMTKDQKLISHVLGRWVTIGNHLVDFEMREWADRAPRLQNLKKEYKWVMENLQEDNGNLYSGVSLSPYTLQLVATTKKEKAEGPQELAQIATKHFESHQDEFADYQEFKKTRPALESAKKFFEAIFTALSKKGRIS